MKELNSAYTINLDDILMNNEQNISNLFNDYFAIIGSNLNAGMKISAIDQLLSYMGVIYMDTFFFLHG